MSEVQHTVVDVIGWIYFSAWSLSFYGQIYENFKLKNVEGMNFDFVGMNMTGFLFYSIYNTYGYFINPDQTGHVDTNDVIFAYHALFATLVTLSQIAIYPSKSNRIHRSTMTFLIALWSFALIYGSLTYFQVYKPQAKLGLISFLGYFKLAISSLKYLPQMYWNYQRKSTKGWSIFNIILDLTGGLFSFGQLTLEVIFNFQVDINIVKLILGIMVVFYDIIFIVQHYCLYRPKLKTQQVQQIDYSPPLLYQPQSAQLANQEKQTQTLNP